MTQLSGDFKQVLNADGAWQIEPKLFKHIWLLAEFRGTFGCDLRSSLIGGGAQTPFSNRAGGRAYIRQRADGFRAWNPLHDFIIKIVQIIILILPRIPVFVLLARKRRRLLPLYKDIVSISPSHVLKFSFCYFLRWKTQRIAVISTIMRRTWMYPLMTCQDGTRTFDGPWTMQKKKL